MDMENVIKAVEEALDLVHSDFIGTDDFNETEWEQNKIDVLALLKEQKWHLITEDVGGYLHGLPGDDGQYLMTDGKDIWIDDYVDGVDDGIWLDSGRDIREIRAWMYMPKLPILD